MTGASSGLGHVTARELARRTVEHRLVAAAPATTPPPRGCGRTSERLTGVRYAFAAH
ncbi:hypothetical protein [Streptomyces sp. KL2]|uniref:hypothetical protein n=1 Tax=Streptomyces sp. KL2 TaxID=3050126 RepID=UPI003978760F